VAVPDERDLAALEEAPLPETKAALFERIAVARRALDGTAAALTEDELADIRDGAGWSTADHLSHIAAWERMIVAHLTDGSDHEIVGVDPARYAAMSLDEINNALYHRLRGLSLDDALAEYRAAHLALVSFLRSLDDAAFALPFWDDDPSRRTVMDKVTGDTYRHYLEHRRWITQLTHRM
jgi:hypothetical protein